MRKRIDSFFFSPEKPEYLGVCRILFFGWMFIWYWNFDFNIISRHPEEFWYPIHLFQIFGLNQLPSAQTLSVLAGIWMVGLFLACIGLFTRLGFFISLAVGTYLLGLTHSFAKINHSDAGLLFAMGIFLFSRAGDSLSVDRFLRNLGKRRNEIPGPSGEYRWPVQMIRVILVLIFFLAGISKLLASGLNWITSDHFATTLTRAQYTREVALPIGEWVASIPWLCVLLAFGAIFSEVAAPAALFSVWARRLIIPALFGMQVGIRLLMGDNFSQFMALYLFWVPWLAVVAGVQLVGAKARGRLASRLAPRHAGEPEIAVSVRGGRDSLMTSFEDNPYKGNDG